MTEKIQIESTLPKPWEEETTFNDILYDWMSRAPWLAISAITYPLWAAVVTVLYYDLRVRNEGFDLQLLAQGVGSDTSRFETSPERPSAPPPSASGGGFRPPEEPATSS